MIDFSDVRFRGTFRDYQQTVLDNASLHLRDKKIHIVAAPGSGKTVLGLELIRYLNSPTLVLSPSITIRQQWGDRFEERFLPEGCSLDSYVSYDLKEPRALTTVTYQALHAASTHKVNEESLDIGGEEDFEPTNTTKTSTANNSSAAGTNTAAGTCASTAATTDAAVELEDFKDFDLVARMKECGVKVICLDEAHHLRSEWHKALVAFIKALDKAQRSELTIIALTATPPYDSTKAEWNRYLSLCGPIDEEIFVPELVMKKTLCPHQDYVYFSYPTTSEREAFKTYRRRAEAFLEELHSSGVLGHILLSTPPLQGEVPNLDTILKNEKEFFALFRMAKRFGAKLPPAIEELVRQRKRYIKVETWKESFREFEAALQFVIDNPEVFTEQNSEELRKFVARHGLLERRQVRLLSDTRLKRMLMSSMGKLRGITQVVLTETASMGENLRMLILTDYIRKEMLPVIGSDAALLSMGAVPIFESVRRTVGEGSLVAILTGTLIIIPAASREGVLTIAQSRGIEAKCRPIEGVEYVQVEFVGSNKHKVAVITEAFQQGFINILIGTKSLLGEGWDSPCINALILASFVGSFMLSNQMRGRAIRIDPRVPDKTANIWHLATMEPVLDPDTSLLNKLGYSGLEQTRELDGDDWETLVRRFDCFMGPAYSRRAIESGVERLDAIQAPYDQAGIERINGEMEARARDRAAMARGWTNALPTGFYPVIEEESEYVPPKLPTTFVFANTIPAILLVLVDLLLSGIVTALFVTGALQNISTMALMALIGPIFALVNALLVRLALRITRLFSPLQRVKTLARALLVTLGETGHIKSLGARTRVVADPSTSYVLFGLRMATIHEQNLFAEAMRELLSPIDNPRYLIIRSHGMRHDYRLCYACPTLLAARSDDAALLRTNISHLLGTHTLVNTMSAGGRETLWKCTNRSLINQGVEIFNKLVTLSKNW